MKIKNLFLSMAFVLLFVSCEKDPEKIAGCSVTGLWTGTWQSTDTLGGTFFAPVYQEDIQVEGDAYIRFALPNLDNYGTEITGTVINSMFKSFFDISYVDIKVTGTVENDSAVEGNFETTIGINGTYSGKKNALSEPEYTEIYSSEELANDILCVGQKLWVFTMETIYDDWEPKAKVVKQLDFNGNFIDTIHFPNYETIYGDNISYGDGKIQVTDNSKFQIKIYDTLGRQLTYFSYPTYNTDVILSLNNRYYLADGYNRVTHVLNANGVEESVFQNPFISYNSMCEYKGNLLVAASLYNILMKTDMNGVILEAYKLPGICNSICTNGNDIFCFTEEYISVVETEPGYMLSKIYKFQID